jgi:ParB-like nuclease domain
MVPAGGSHLHARNTDRSYSGTDGLSEVYRIPVASLRASDSPRHQAQSAEHARVLAESDEELPPIVVHRLTMRVIDGTHRVLAATLRGQSEIAVRFFDGPAEDAFVLAVEANTRHGLPLSLAERTAAASRILHSHPHWSDRAIASVTGLSPKTVRAQRQRLGGATARTAARLGRDGRVRPLNSAEGRRIAGRLIQESPGASLRVIAKKAGISPGTVRDVRARLSRGEDIVPSRQRSRPRTPAPAPRPEPRLPAVADVPGPPFGDDHDVVEVFRSLCRDPSLRLTENGRQLLRMVELHVGDPERWERVAESVPAYRAQIVAALAMHCAARWQRFAAEVRGTAAARFPLSASRGAIPMPLQPLAGPEADKPAC